MALFVEPSSALDNSYSSGSDVRSENKIITGVIRGKGLNALSSLLRPPSSSTTFSSSSPSALTMQPQPTYDALVPDFMKAEPSTSDPPPSPAALPISPLSFLSQTCCALWVHDLSSVVLGGTGESRSGGHRGDGLDEWIRAKAMKRFAVTKVRKE
jgi:hypothetical protein